MIVDISIFVTALAAFVTALVNWLSASRLSRSVEAQLFLDFSHRYNSDEMRQAITHLMELYLREPATFSSRWRGLRERRDEEWNQVHKSGRLVVRYFVDVQRLQEAGYISKRFALLLIDHPGLNVFYEIMVPAMLLIRPDIALGGIAQRLKSVLPRHGNGLYTN